MVKILRLKVLSNIFWHFKIFFLLLQLNYYEEFEDYDECCLNGLECCTLLWPHKILKATKEGTRIYVFVGSDAMLIR